MVKDMRYPFLFASFAASCAVVSLAAPQARAQTAPRKKPAPMKAKPGKPSPKPAPPIAPAAPPAAAVTLQSLTVNLRFMKPTEFVQRLLGSSSTDTTGMVYLPNGIVRVSPDDPQKRVFVQGTPESVAKIQEIARLLDVTPQKVRLELRVLRAVVNANLTPESAKQSEVITTVSSESASSKPVLLHALGDGQLFRLLVTPKINADNTITLVADLSELANLPASKTPTVKQETRLWTRRVQNGATIIAASLPNFKNRDTEYFLEVTPSVTLPPAD